MNREESKRAQEDAASGSAESGPQSRQSANPALVPGTRLGVYEIVSILGTGGMGQVYRAFDTKLRRPVAVKVLVDGARADTAGKRLLHEARLACALNHPIVCTVHEVSEIGNLSFIVQEFIEGRPLSELIPSSGLPIEQVLNYGRQIADVTAHAHSKGIVHRDLKSANVIVTPSGRIKVLDFGIARRLPNNQPDAVTDRKSSLEQAGAIAGTLPYMAPETLRGEAADERTDIWALGIILFEMATGARPFQGRTTFELSEEILHKPVPPIRPSDPPSLRATILRCLAKERGQRYQRSDELRAALEALESGAGNIMPSSSRGFSVEARRWAPVALLAVLAAMVVAAAGWFFTRDARRQAAADDVNRPFPALESLEVRQLTSTGNADSPALSPDGRYVAYAVRVRQPRRDSLFVRQIATGSSIEVAVSETDEAIGGSTITPDGAFVDFVRYSLPAQKGALWRIALLGGQQTRISDDLVSAAGWSPDRKHIAFVRQSVKDKTTQLILSNAVGDQEGILATRSGTDAFIRWGDYYFSHNRPAWSLDGHSIALLAHGSKGDVIDIVDVGARSVRTIPTDLRVGTNVAWLDSSNLILNGQTADVEISQLWRVSVATGRLTRVTNGLSDYLGVSVTVDGNALVTNRGVYRAGIWIADGAGRQMAVAVPPNEEHGTPDMFWAGSRLFYISGPTGTSQLFAHAPGAPPQLVATSAPLDAKIWRDFDGSSDGRLLLGTRQALTASNPDGREGLTLLAANIRSIRPTPDGRVVVAVSNPSGTTTIWIVPVRGGEPTKVMEAAGLHSAELSPDGQKLLVEKSDEQTERAYFVCEPPQCSSQRALRFRGRVGSAHWLPQSDLIVYEDSATRNLWTRPWNRDAATQLTFFTDGYDIDRFSWSLDGKQLAIMRWTMANDVVLFTGLKR